MARANLVERVTSVEQRLDRLEQVPGRLDQLTLEIVQRREEMNARFAAITDELVLLRSELRAEFRADLQAMADTLRAEFRADLQAMADALRAEMRALNEETRRHMLVLHEDLVSRITLLGEALNGKRRAPRATGRGRGPTKKS